MRAPFVPSGLTLGLIALAAPAGVLVAAMAPQAWLAVPLAALRLQTCATTTPNQPHRYGTGSVAEASALAACGPGARLLRPREIAPGGLATVALAEGTDP